MQIVDAHHHIWIPEQTQPDLGYGWLRDIGSMKPFGDPTPIQRDYPWSEFSTESSAHQLVGSVYVQVDGAIKDPVAETEWVQSVVELPAEHVGIVGLVNLAGNEAQVQMESQSRVESFRGVRQIISHLDDNPALCFSPEHYLRNPRWRDHFKLLEEHGLSFDLQLYPEQMHEAAEFLSQFPSVPVVIDHAGSPHDQSAKGLALWRDGMSALSQLDTTCVKLSGFGMFDRNWSAASIQPIINDLLDSFGPRRIMFGSNFPVDKLMADYDSVVERVLASIASAGEDTVLQVFAKTAREFYRLK